MKLNKERFLKTELGGALKECITSWDISLDACRKHGYYTDDYKGEEKRRIGAKRSGKFIKWRYGSFTA